MKKLYIRLFFTFLCVCSCHSQIFAESENIYATWENMEIDKCASAWLIRRFIDKNAVFKFFPKDELITEGIPFDVPEAEIRRYHNISTFEYLIKKYKIADPALQKIGKIIHDIEINYWGKKQIEESQKINDSIQEIIENSKTAEEVITRSFIFFDKLYSSMGRAMPNQ